MFIHKRQALNFDEEESLKSQPLSISSDDVQNRESVHYARGCQSILRNYLSDVETSIEYSTDDALRNIDNALLLKAQSVIEVGLRRHNLREELYCQVWLYKWIENMGITHFDPLCLRPKSWTIFFTKIENLPSYYQPKFELPGSRYVIFKLKNLQI